MAENEELLFVELALKRELVTPEHVDEVHALKARLAEMGLDEHLADLLVKRGMISEGDAALIRARVGATGRQWIEGYRLVERLGRGGMGSVYKAVQVSMDRFVALKVLKPSLTRDDQQVARLKREAQLVGRLEHPNIVRGLDFGLSNGFYYFAMEYVEGESVKEAVEKKGPFKEKDALRIVREVALALDHAHGEGIVHRDVKPGNILIGRDGSTRLADYGLAKGPIEDQQLTQSGVTVGTPQYISPEQARGPSGVDIRTDIYSLGATLYHMVTGRPPYEGETLAHLIQQVLYEPYAPPRTLRRNLSPNTCFLIEKMMARRSRHRYQGPRELLADLERIEKGKSIVPAGWQGDFEAFHLRRRLRRAITATVAVLLLGGAASLVLNWQLEQARRGQVEASAREEWAALGRETVTASNIAALIRRHEKLVEEYEDTEAGGEAKRHLRHLRRQSVHLEAAREQEIEARDLAEKEEWAAALRALREFGAGLPEGDGDLARGEAEASVRMLLDRRDQEVARAIGESLVAYEALPPGEARDALRRRIADFELRAYLPEEDRPALARASTVLGDLDRAIEGTERHLSGPRGLLDHPSPRDYRRFAEVLEAARKSWLEDRGVSATLSELPVVWADRLRSTWDLLAAEALKLNAGEAAKALVDSRALVDGARYQEAIALLADLSARSLPGVAPDLRSEQEKITVLLEGARKTLGESWQTFLPMFLDQVGARRWSAAEAELARLRNLMGLFVPNDFLPQVRAADTVLAMAQAVEEAFLRSIDGRAVLSEGLLFGRVRYWPMYEVTVSGRDITFRRESGGRPEVLSVERVSVDDLRRECGLPLTEPGVRMLFALFRLGELRAQQDDRALRNALPDIENEILAGKGNPSLAPLAEDAAALLREQRTTADDRLRIEEDSARVKYDQALKHMEARRWQEAFDLLNLLLTDPRLSRTDFVKQREESIRRDRDEVRAKLPAGRLRDYFGARSDHLAGVSVNSGYRAVLYFDWEDPAEIARFTLSPGRVAISEVNTLFIGPEPPEQGPEPATQKEHVLRFLPPEKIPDDWLDRHPLRLGSPFVWSDEIAVEFRVRFPNPVALVISVCGVNVAILSDESRQENGRGVHVWQAADASRPDLAVPDEFRSTYLARRPDLLAGEAARERYFRFEANRWYRVRFVKGAKDATLFVDGRALRTEKIQQYVEKSDEIVLRTWTPSISTN
ncbi:MAG: serine/threonine protein kinase [Planctomycetes bacterium]|nr:serine/threonine protein kinase [Planctomycetota bacterium]